ncbi:MAG: BACON domain-containing protein [Bacteroidaceae bacterium]|nr:BACON domain-containing protein [Bacteroidaceae bacterium]
MKIQHYCYTRNSHIDYGDFVLPDLPKNQVDFIRKHILSITGDSNPKFTIPKWILIKFDDVIVWGCCCWNSLLAENHFKDSLGRPVYGFFSIVITNFIPDEVKLPSDIDYFKELYSKEIEPYWNSSERRYSATDASISDRYKYIRAGREVNLTLNTDLFQCLSLGNLDKDMVVSAALTLDNVSLLIDNDNIQQATNKKGAFMNCLSSAVAPGSYTVKQLCPQCKEYVSAFTSAGICSTCKEKDQARIVTIKKEEEDMDKQLRRELDDANSKILYLQYDIEEAKKSIKKKNLLIKVLLGVIVLLLLGLLYTYCASPSFGTMGYDKEQTNQHEVINNISSESKPSYENRLFLNSEIVVGVEGRQSLVVEYNKSYTNVDFIPNVDWVKVISKTPNLILQVQPYESDGRREAIITAKYGQYNDTLTITQKK